jgi:hypothetical protein
LEDNPEKGRKKVLIEELNNKDLDSSDVDITAMLEEIEEDMDLDELVRQKALLQEKLKKGAIPQSLTTSLPAPAAVGAPLLLE